MEFNIGDYKIELSFDVVDDNLDNDILCYTEADKYSRKIPEDWSFVIAPNEYTNDWQIADGKKALEQDLIEGFRLKYFDDIIDVQEGNDIWKFKNRTYTKGTAIELKQNIENWLSMDDRINISTLKVNIINNALEEY